MKFNSLAILALSNSALGQMVNRTATNGWGSTPAQRHYISADQALTVINAGINYSNSIGQPNNIAVMDPSSQLVAFLRMDNAYLGSVDISMKKAKTVTSFNGLFPSYGLLNRSQPGGDLFAIEETNGGLVVFGGGETPSFFARKLRLTIHCRPTNLRQQRLLYWRCWGQWWHCPARHRHKHCGSGEYWDDDCELSMSVTCSLVTSRAFAVSTVSGALSSKTQNGMGTE